MVRRQRPRDADSTSITMRHSGTVRHSSAGGINGEAQSPRSVGLVDGRPRAHRLRTDQAERIAHAAAVELEVWKPTAGDQLGLAVKSPWCRRYAYIRTRGNGTVTRLQLGNP